MLRFTNTLNFCAVLPFFLHFLPFSCSFFLEHLISNLFGLDLLVRRCLCEGDFGSVESRLTLSMRLFLSAHELFPYCLLNQFPVKWLLLSLTDFTDRNAPSLTRVASKFPVSLIFSRLTDIALGVPLSESTPAGMGGTCQFFFQLID